MSSCIENLNQEIYESIFQFLNVRDIFILGQCSSTFMQIVTRFSRHPIAIQLEAMKTTEVYYTKNETPYASVMRDITFLKGKKCKREGCICGNYRQRKDCTMLDPSVCFHCLSRDTWSVNCSVHFILILEFLRLSKCYDCFNQGEYCNKCKEVVDEI